MDSIILLISFVISLSFFDNYMFLRTMLSCLLYLLLYKFVFKLNFFKAMLFGILFSISWTPCIGSFLSSALLIVAKGQNLIKGIILMLLYSIGLGIPFVISVVLMEKLKNLFSVIKNNYQIIKKVSGIILIIMGLYVML